MFIVFSERRCGLVVVITQRAIDQVEDGRLSAFCIVTSDGTEYFNIVVRDLPRAYLLSIV